LFITEGLRKRKQRRRGGRRKNGEFKRSKRYAY
jgi:hypothetical protein